MDETNIEIKKNRKTKTKLLILIISIISILVAFCLIFIRSTYLSQDVVVHISSDNSLNEIIDNLEDKNIVKSKFFLKSTLYLLGDKHISSGDYLFKRNESIVGVTYQLLASKHDINKVKVILKEGVTRDDIADILSIKILNFNRSTFLNDARSKEGYLFPDTYFFYPMSTTDEILNEINSNFKKKISSLDNEIKNSGKDMSDIIIMASILEKEAGGQEDIGYISGILWKRIDIGMALQVDAAPVTYDRAGLPDKPICNPGLMSIKAAINPKDSPYLFYLHDSSGKVHYADDFSEHRSNIAKYLK